MRPSLPWVANCPNAIDLAAYPFAPRRGDYLVFLGRMSPDKGAHRAIQVALRTGLPLKIAAKMREPREREYFEAFVRPHLSSRIEYVGEVGHQEKVALLRDARAMLFPISWEEPFGLVVVESMACGTPVIATRRGAVPEVIEDGVTGVIVAGHHQMPAALEAADRLDPREIRRRAEQHFSPARMLADYGAAYRATLAAAEAPVTGRADRALTDAAPARVRTPAGLSDGRRGGRLPPWPHGPSTSTASSGAGRFPSRRRPTRSRG
jgi:glycosyltransferase involved in cell wall biosynthesis